MTPSRPLLAVPLLGALLLASAGCKNAYERREIDPEAQLDLYVTTATYLYEDGSLDRAQDQAVKALELDPENRALRRMVGWIRLRRGGPEDLIIAERFFRELMDENDSSTATVLGLATTLERLGLGHDEASREFASGVRPTPDGKPSEEKAREMAARARDLWHESLELYESTLTNGDGSTRTLNGLQRVNALLGRYEESLGWSQRLIDRSAAELADWQRMLQAEDLSESEENLLRANEAEATDLQIETHLFAASLLQSLGEDLRAVEHLSAVAELEPERAEIYSRRAQLRARLGDHRRAIEDVDRFLKRTDLPFEHADVQRAFELRAASEKELRGRAPE